jgi:hypothetical protein
MFRQFKEKNKNLLRLKLKSALKITQISVVFTVFRLLTDFVCLYNYEFWLSLCKIVRSSVVLLLPLFVNEIYFKFKI